MGKTYQEKKMRTRSLHRETKKRNASCIGAGTLSLFRAKRFFSYMFSPERKPPLPWHLFRIKNDFVLRFSFFV